MATSTDPSATAPDKQPVRPSQGMTPRNLLRIGIVVFIIVVLVAAFAMQMRVSDRDEKRKSAPQKIEVGAPPSPVEIEKMANEQRTRAKQEAVQSSANDAEPATQPGAVPSVVGLSSQRPPNGPQSLQSLGAAGNTPTSRALVQGRTSDGNFLTAPRPSDFDSSAQSSGAPVVGEPSVSAPILMASSSKAGPLADAGRAVRELTGAQAPDFRAIAANAQMPDPASVLAQMRPQAPLTASEQNQSFLREARQSQKQRAIRTDSPEAAIIVLEGAVIQAVTESAINSDLPGQIRAKVTQDVYDSIRGNVLVIPKGARLIGTYNANVANAQSRILMVFNRLILPDGRSLDLQGMAGGEPNGMAGATGDINHHFMRNFGAGFLVAGLTYALGRRDPQVNVTVNSAAGSPPATLSTAAGQILIDTAKSAIDTYKQPRPTITIESGSLFSILVQRDLIVEPRETATRQRKTSVFDAITAAPSR